MFNDLIGWYLNNVLGINFDTIRFEISIGAGSSTTPTKVSRTVLDAFEGASKITRLTGGENFFITNIHHFTEPGKTYFTLLPDNSTLKQVQILSSKPRDTNINPIKELDTGLSIDLFNQENQSNDITIILEGFWITEQNTATLTDLAAQFYRTLQDIDEQTLKSNQLLLGVASRLDITNALLINPRAYTPQTLAAATPPLISIPQTDETRVGIGRRCGKLAPTGKEPESDEEE